MFIINAPMLFNTVWKVMKGFFDENTQKKIQILGSNYRNKLLEKIDDDKLPDFLGGKAECHLERNIGPWNPEGKELYGVKNKMEIDIEENSD